MAVESALISIGTWLSTKIADKGFDQVAKKIASNSVDAKFRQAVSKTSSVLERKYPGLLGGSFDYFFQREEVFSELFKLLFRNARVSAAQISKNFDTSTLPPKFIKEYVSALKQELLRDRDFDEILSDKALYISIQGLGVNAKLIAENSTITNAEIKRISKLLLEKLGESFSFEEFFKIYKQNAVNNLQQINFIGLGIDISIKKKRKNLQDVFVKPFFKAAEEKRPIRTASGPKLLDEHFKPLWTYDNILEKHSKLVILGNPGAGKSLVVKALMCDILLNRESLPACAKGALPFRIELRKYLAHKREFKGNILRYMVSVLEEEYQINAISENILDNILKKHNCIIFFDGLDEIFDVKDKIEIKNDVENFDGSYSNLTSVVTSRIIGYEDAPLNKEKFRELTILNFNEIQVEEYVRKWYVKEEDIFDVREREIKGFLSKRNEIDKELISNPLLLSLIVIIYRNVSSPFFSARVS